MILVLSITYKISILNTTTILVFSIDIIGALFNVQEAEINIALPAYRELEQTRDWVDDKADSISEPDEQWNCCKQDDW